MKILVEKAVIEQVLEALGGYDSDFNTKHYDLITALQEALAEPKKPEECENGCPPLQVCDYCQIAEQAEQEPVAWMNDSTPSGVFARHKEGAENFGCTIPLYAAPVRTKDLTDDEIAANWAYRPLDFARAVIAADREKNK